VTERSLKKTKSRSPAKLLQATLDEEGATDEALTALAATAINEAAEELDPA
jgi:ferritin-like metal-binding protein YciE